MAPEDRFEFENFKKRLEELYGKENLAKVLADATRALPAKLGERNPMTPEEKAAKDAWFTEFLTGPDAQAWCDAVDGRKVPAK